MSSEHDNMAVVRREAQAFNERDLETIRHCLADEFVASMGNSDETTTFRGDEIDDLNRVYFDKLDATLEEQEMFASGDTVFVRWVWTYRHVGELTINGTTYPPTGKEFTCDEWQVLRLEGGRICEDRTLRDQLTFLRELGALE